MSTNEIAVGWADALIERPIFGSILDGPCAIYEEVIARWLRRVVNEMVYDLGAVELRIECIGPPLRKRIRQVPASIKILEQTKLAPPGTWALNFCYFARTYFVGPKEDWRLPQVGRQRQMELATEFSRHVT